VGVVWVYGNYILKQLYRRGGGGEELLNEVSAWLTILVTAPRSS